MKGAMKLNTQVLLFGLSVGLGGFAQESSSPGPESNAPVFLDNHRPLNPKKEKNPTTRTVTGQVVDDSGQPLEGALVTLVDGKTKERFEYFTKKDGRYKFEDLSFSVDYQLRAKWKSLISDERKLSQYDHTARIIRQLQVTTPEGAPPPSTEAKTDKPKS
jgi:hypothetical protein